MGAVGVASTSRICPLQSPLRMVGLTKGWAIPRLRSPASSNRKGRTRRAARTSLDERIGKTIVQNLNQRLMIRRIKNGQKNEGCFIYDGPHKAKDCPKRETLNAIVDDGSREGSDSD